MFNNITLRTLSTAIDDQFELTTAYIDDIFFKKYYINNFINRNG